MSGSTIWFDGSREHFWRVPEGAELPPGDLEIRNLSGERRTVEAGSLDAWAIPPEQTRRAVLDELRAAARHTAGALGVTAQGWWTQALSALPEEVSWQELERRLGPMDTWVSTSQETVKTGRESVQRTARQARDTVRRASRVASSTVRSARTVGKIVLDNPELAETASRWAETLAGRGRKDPDKS